MIYNNHKNTKVPILYNNDSAPAKGQKLFQLPRLVLFCDSEGLAHVRNPKTKNYTIDSDGDGLKDSTSGNDKGNFAPKRHGGSAGYCFTDGSASSISYKEWETNVNNSGWLWDATYNL